MKAVHFLGNRRVSVDEVPILEPPAGWVRVRSMASAICGSDMHGYRADKARGQVPGHEPCGIVDKLGECVTDVEIGMRTMVYHLYRCEHCKYCYSGEYWSCVNKIGYASSDADYILAPAGNCLPLPDDFSYVDGALISCNVGTAYNTAKRLGVNGLDSVIVFGMGPVGLYSAQMAKEFGAAQVLGVDLVPERLALAERIGVVDTALNGREVDVVEAAWDLTGGEGATKGIETSGAPKARVQMIDSLRQLGWGALVGIHTGEDDATTLYPSRQLLQRQIGILGCHVFNKGDYGDMVELIRNKKVDLSLPITHRFRIEDAAQAFELYDTLTTGKVVFEWEDPQ